MIYLQTTFTYFQLLGNIFRQNFWFLFVICTLFTCCNTKCNFPAEIVFPALVNKYSVALNSTNTKKHIATMKP